MSLIPSMTTRGVRALVPGIPVYQPPRRNAVRVRVKRHGVWHDITHRVHRGTVRHTNDDPVATLELTLLNGEGYPSLAPRVKDSPLNRGDRPKWSDIAHLRWSDVAHLRWSELPLADRYSPLLDRYNEILVEAAISTDGSEPTDFVPVFHGLLGDDIRSEHTADAGVVIHLSARDMAKRLQDDFILEPIRFENAYASQIIQGLLNDRFGPGEIQLYVVGEDDFWVDEVTFEYIDTWQAIQSFCEQSDKDVRYLYDPVSGEIRLTYWTPDTTMTPVWNVQSGDIIHETLQTSDASLRHGVVIRYVDADGNRQQVSIVDESLRKPKEPLRIALIEEADTSYIRDEEAAQRMAQAVFAALRTEPATDLLRIPFHPYMRIYDVIAVENPKLRSEFELYAIEDLQFHFSADEWWTEITASESVKIRHQIWLAKEAKQGVKAPIKGDELRFGDVPGDRLEPGSVEEYILDPAVFAITPSSVPKPSSGSLEDLWDRDPETGVTFPSAPTITYRYPVYQASDAIEVHVSNQARGYVQMRYRDTGQWIDVLGSQANPVIFPPGWSYHRFDGGKLYFGREYRLVLIDNVRINELRFERITVADLIMAGKLRLTGDMAIESADGKSKITSTVWEHRGPNDELLFHLEGGNAFFGGQLAAKSVKTENIVDGAISNLVVQKFNTEISKTVTVPVSDSYSTMPDMTFQYQVTRPCRLFIVVSAPVNGLFRYHVVAQYAIFGEIWAHPQTRFIVNGQVIDEDPTPPSSLDFPSIVSPGTYMHELVFTENDSFPQTVTGRVEWRVAAGGHDFEPSGGKVWIRNLRRGYSILELAK